MPAYYIYRCAICGYERERYRNVKKCPKCKGDLKRMSEPKPFHLSKFSKSIEVTENQHSLLKGLASRKHLPLRELLDQIITDYMIRTSTNKGSK